MRSVAYFASHILFVLVAIPSLRADLARAVSAVAKCYNPDGSTAAGDFPCFLGQGASACCAQGVQCLSTGLCDPQGAIGASDFIRGTCTDSTWNSSNCPQYCLGSSTGGTNLISCQNVTNNDQDFCCDHTNGCCDSGIGRFRIGAEASTIATIGPSGVSVTIRQSMLSSPSSSSHASSMTTSPTPAVSSAPSSITSSASSSATASPINTTAASSSSNATSIGIGVGVGVGACVLLILGFLLFRYRRKIAPARKQPYQAAPSMEQSSMEPHGDFGHDYPGNDTDGPTKSFDGANTRSELDGVPRAELDSRSRPAEMGP